MPRSASEHPDVAVDAVVLSWREDPQLDPLRAELLVAVVPHEELDGWALPGGYVQLRETVESRLAAVLADKVGLPELHDGHRLHLQPFSDPARDPRRRTISLPVLVLLPHRDGPRPDPDRVTWAAVDSDQAGGSGTRIVLDGRSTTLVIDHDAIVATAVEELRRRLQADDLDVLVGLLPPAFGLRELERLWNAISGEPVNTASFRRRMTGLRRPGGGDRRWLEETGGTGAWSSGRAAKLYRWTAAG